MIATAALFLAAKSEETPCALNSMLRASCETSQELELSYYPYLHHKVNVLTCLYSELFIISTCKTLDYLSVQGSLMNSKLAMHVSYYQILWSHYLK